MSTNAVDEPWRPLSAREATEGGAVYDTLVPGVPEWLRPSLWEWIRPRVCQTFLVRSGGPYSSGTTRETGLDVTLIREMERKLRFQMPPWPSYDRRAGIQALKELLYGRPDLMLNIADFLDSQLDPNSRVASEGSGPLDQLDQILSESGSAYRVASEMRPPRLVRRVDATAEQAATRLINVGGPPAELLADAWHATYGLHPNPSDGYRQAVRAVEAAAIPVVLPTDRSATLGKVIGSLRQGVHKWQLSLTHQTDAQGPVETLVKNLELLWQGQYDRHVTESAPLRVSQEEAETALHLAVTLVQWFTSGSVSRKPGTI